MDKRRLLELAASVAGFEKWGWVVDCKALKVQQGGVKRFWDPFLFRKDAEDLPINGKVSIERLEAGYGVIRCTVSVSSPAADLCVSYCLHESDALERDSEVAVRVALALAVLNLDRP